MLTVRSIKLILKNHSEEYAAREMITAHIPKVKIEICDFVPDSTEDYVISSLEIKDGSYVYTTVLNLSNKLYNDCTAENKYSKTYVKKSINSAFCRAFGTNLPWGLITGIRPSKIVRELADSGVSRTEIKKYLKDFYLCSDDKIKIATDVAYRERELIKTIPKNSVSLYVGIPFCPTRCLYCSFTSQSVKFSNKLMEPYMDALEKEIISTAEIIKNNGLTIDTVYIGGGTPTSLSEAQLKRLLDCLFRYFEFGSIREFTLEAGRPDTITHEKLNIIKEFGISRISINPQTMNQKTLDIIGRRHTPEDIVRTYELAERLGFNHINTDIIAGLPEENEADFDYTLNELEKVNPQSITVHTMSIKHGSFLDGKYSMYTQTAADTVNNMLNNAAKRMKKLKKKPYYMYRQKNMLGNLENVGYCDANHECLYNIYIMEEVQSIYSVGAGASTKIINGSKIERIFNVKEVSEYIKRIDEMIKRKDILKL